MFLHPRVNLERQDQQVLQDLQAPKAPQGILVNLVPKVHLAYQEHLAILELLVKLVKKGLRDLQAQKENQVQLVLLALLVCEEILDYQDQL